MQYQAAALDIALYCYLVRNNWSTWWWPKERPKHAVVPTICYVKKTS